MTYPALACGQNGVSYITQPFKGGDTLHLALNGGANFPSLEDQQFFYALLVDPCRTRCISVKVIATQGDTFSVASVATDCFPAGSKLHFDDNSVAALQERLPGLIREVNNPLVFANGKLMLDWDTFKEAFQEVLLSAQAPLQYDAQSGNLTLDVDALFNDQKSKILGWLSATAPLEYDETNGVFSIDIAGLKTALGITT